jgi:GNAT superfamily N-acetyltransferase
MTSPTAFEFFIRLITEEDIKTPERWAISSFKRDFEDEKILGFVAVHDEKIIGYVTLEFIPDDTVFSSRQIPEITDLYVLRIYRHRGIATALIRACEEKARERGWTIIGLSVGIMPEDATAHRLYKQLGYRPIEGVSENWSLALYKRLG